MIETRKANSCKTKGLKKIARSISDPPAKPLLFVKRDKPSEDGGLIGQLTSEPTEVDAIAKRAWEKV